MIVSAILWLFLFFYKSKFTNLSMFHFCENFKFNLRIRDAFYYFSNIIISIFFLVVLVAPVEKWKTDFNDEIIEFIFPQAVWKTLWKTFDLWKT
jgi:hypothetical protein